MKMRIFALTTLLLALAYSGVVSAQEGAVKYRQAIMKSVGGHASAIAEIAYGQVPHKEHLQAHVDGLSAVAKHVTTAFKAEVITEDPPTAAKADIWQKWPEFEEKVADMEAAIAGIAEASTGGDLGAVAGSLDPLWDSCKGCHKAFKAKDK